MCVTNIILHNALQLLQCNSNAIASPSSYPHQWVNFSFSVDTRGKEVSTPQKKKKTPSTLRRDARRREELLRKKLNAPTAEKAFMCDHCENTFKSENGLKIHIGKSHKKVDSTPATPERLRQQTNSSVSLSASPLLDTSREESSAVSPVSEDDIKSTSKKPVPRYQPLPMKCNHCDLYLPWVVKNWKGAPMEPRHICTCNP